MKKEIKQTGFGQFLTKIAKDIPSLALDVVDIATSGKPVSAAINMIAQKLTREDVDFEKAQVALQEIAAKRKEWELEAYELESKDRERASMMYNKDNDMANKIANNIITRNLAYIFALLICQVVFSFVTTTLVDDKTIAVSVGGTIGTIIGTVIGSLLQERNQVVGFFFGSSIKNSKQIKNGKTD